MRRPAASSGNNICLVIVQRLSTLAYAELSVLYAAPSNLIMSTTDGDILERVWTAVIKMLIIALCRLVHGMDANWVRRCHLNDDQRGFCFEDDLNLVWTAIFS